MKNKETATEWLFKQLWDEPKDKFTWNTILMKAKEMEKEQIMKAVYDSMGTNFDPNMGRAEQYYNETFNSSTNK
jgi:tRNA A37 threonylcarbamoyladenosine modification protein TsaB